MILKKLPNEGLLHLKKIQNMYLFNILHVCHQKSIFKQCQFLEIDLDFKFKIVKKIPFNPRNKYFAYVNFP